jgi:putative ABC transport system permease protein
MNRISRVASRLLWREWRSGEFNLLAIALVIAVASMTSVAFITDRVASALQQKAGDLIAADLVVKSSTPSKPAWQQEATARGVRSASTMSFASVVLAGDNSSLASVKAVSASYPLRGVLKTATAPYTDGVETPSVPARGNAWLDSRLLNALDIEVGSAIELGSSSLRITRILTFEPDFAGDLFGTAPRLLINIDDVPDTGLVGFGSRVSYRQLFAAPQPQLADFERWLRDRLRPDDSLQDIRAARPELKTALERADRFLGLAALIAVMLAAVAIVISARRFAERHRGSSALMRTFGASQSDILRLFIIQLGILGVVAALVGSLLGYAAHLLVAESFGYLLAAELPPVSASSALPGMVTGLLLIYCFALPPLYRLRHVPPIQVLRSASAPTTTSSLLHYLPAALLFPALVTWQAGDLQLAAVYLGGLLLTVVVLAATAMLLLSLLDRLRRHTGLTLRIGLTYLIRRRHNTLTETVGFGLGIMAIILLVLVRTDLMDDWLVSLPDDAPNQFVINVQPDQIDDIKTFFAERQRPQPEFYPMIRARLTAINDKAVNAEDYQDPRTQRLATRVFNLSWSDRLQPGNRVVAGQWWQPASKPTPQLSFDEGLAGQLGVGLGDKLTFFSAGQKIEAPITSLRKVNWDTFRPNFFVVAPPDTLAGLPATYISSFHVDTTQREFINQLIREFRNLTVIDVQQMIGQVRTIMDNVSLVLQFVFFFTLGSGLLVLFATMQSTHDERMRDNAIMKTMGASRRQLRYILLAEFVVIGLLSSLVASIAANLTGYGVANWLLKIPYQLHLDSTLLSIAAGTIAISLTGLLAFRQYHRMTAVAVLRQN